LLIVTALSAEGPSLALVVAPSEPVSLLIGASLDTPGGLVVARVDGAVLLSIGAAAGWRVATGRAARQEDSSRPSIPTGRRSAA
jgi:hypothetical protein